MLNCPLFALSGPVPWPRCEIDNAEDAMRRCHHSNPFCDNDRSQWLTIGDELVCPHHHQERLRSEAAHMRHEFEQLLRFENPTIRRYAQRALDQFEQRVGVIGST